jgi:hypothetical protein
MRDQRTLQSPCVLAKAVSASAPPVVKLGVSVGAVPLAEDLPAAHLGVASWAGSGPSSQPV